MKRGRRSGMSFLGALIFFVTVGFVVSAAVMVYAAVSDACHGNKGVVALVMLVVIVVLSAACTGIDFVRRRVMIDAPVQKILDATDAIAKGDFSVRLPISHRAGRYDEYDCIMDNLNKMAAELSRTEVLHSDFIANVSHELKTPLSVLQNYAMSLQRNDLDEGTRRKYAATLVETAARLTALVTDILKLNKLENQEIKPAYERVDLGEMLAESVLAFEDKIEKKGLTLSCDLAEGVYIATLPSYTEIVWQNLLSNAVKFTDAGGTIGVRLYRDGGRAAVQISDTGCGISADAGKHIFEKFYQGDTSHAGEGNGLGLALVKKVIDVIGGEISVQSESGVGTVFTVTLQAEP